MSLLRPWCSTYCDPEDNVTTDTPYLSGFGNVHVSEARPGAVPLNQNAPKEAPYGLFAEALNGSGFTVERAHNLKVWMYRLRPAIHARAFERHPQPPQRFVADFREAVATPEPMRFRPVPMPDQPVDLIDGMLTFAGAGDPAIKRGMAVHLFAANQDMERVFSNIDGDLLLAPEQGRLRVRTELGWLEAEPGEIIVIPRAIRFQVFLPDGAVRGFAAELYDGHFQLPERGPVGANGMADERHFEIPVADFENRPVDTEIVVKQGGQFWRNLSPHSPFDVVGWQGRYYPYKYDLRKFNSLGGVSFDHPDPSILTVLTSPMDTHGRNAIDVATFIGRWDATEHTFRPPYYHRNAAIEFNGVIASPSQTGPYPAGAFSFTPYHTPHGVGADSHRKGVSADDAPVRLSDESIWIQFESTYVLKVMPYFLTHAARDTEFLEQFQGFSLGELAT